MSTKTSACTQAEIIAATSGTWRTARDVHERVGKWAVQTVRHTLARLAREGVIERKVAETRIGVINLYRRKA